jgi:hypothetical protein
MAIARGAGTEIIRCHNFSAINDTQGQLILGVQHHIYTVLSVVVYCTTRSGSDVGRLRIIGYDSYGGTSGATIDIANINIAVNETFVWNDKFSFNGYEPVDFTHPLTTIAEQDAIADQGNTGTFPTGSQYLSLYTGSSGTYYDAIVTFIDQNNE